MEKNQQINCNVSSCKYNDHISEQCLLESIQVAPNENVNSKNPDESMCASYRTIL